MAKLRALVWLMLLPACSASPVAAQLAADVNGAWTKNPAHCDKIFSKRRNGTFFTKLAESYGGGFIIDDSGIRSRLSRCKIKERRTDGAVVHLIASCAYDIMLSDIQVSLKVIDPTTVVRVHPGASALQTPYRRCEPK